MLYLVPFHIYINIRLYTQLCTFIYTHISFSHFNDFFPKNTTTSINLNLTQVSSKILQFYRMIITLGLMLTIPQNFVLEEKHITFNNTLKLKYLQFYTIAPFFLHLGSTVVVSPCTRVDHSRLVHATQCIHIDMLCPFFVNNGDVVLLQ